jgi:chromosome segregation ATPase
MTDDSMATSRAIDALKDPAFQDFAEKIVDRVAALLGNHQLRILDAHTAFDQSLAEIRYQITEANRKADAEKVDRQQIANFLELQGKQLEAVSDGQSALMADFQASAEHLDDRLRAIDERLAGLDTWKQAVDATLEDFHQSRAAAKKDRGALRTDLNVLKKDRTKLHKQLNLILAALDELELGINGRLTQLIATAKAASRAEGHEAGQAEERAHPGKK